MSRKKPLEPMITSTQSLQHDLTCLARFALIPQCGTITADEQCECHEMTMSRDVLRHPDANVHGVTFGQL